MLLYIAADEPLPLIDWQEDVTAFHVAELSEDELIVKKQFTKPFVVCAGSYGGCACGFSYGQTPIADETDAREDALARESVRQLSAAALAYPGYHLSSRSVEVLHQTWRSER